MTAETFPKRMKSKGDITLKSATYGQSYYKPQKTSQDHRNILLTGSCVKSCPASNSFPEISQAKQNRNEVFSVFHNKDIRILSNCRG